MKRFTDTDKWRDPWFRKLSSPAKQLWGYLLDQCDKIGLVEIDLGLASIDCGQKITEAHLAEIGDRIEPCGNGKHFIPKFIPYQYGSLTPTCPPHRSIIALVDLHNLTFDGLLYHYPNATLPLGHKTRKEKEEGVQGGIQLGLNGQQAHKFVKPTLDQLKFEASKAGLPESEALKFFNHYESNGWRVGRNPMKSLPHALANWRTNYQAGVYRNNPQSKPQNMI